MPKTAVVNSNNTSFTVTDGLFKQSYPLIDSSTNLVNNVDGSQTLYLLWGDEVLVVVENTLNSLFAGNSIFGATTPLTAQTAAQTAIGAAGSGGGGGGSSDATAANQVTGNNTLNAIDTKTPTVGQKTSALSSPVVIASDNTIANNQTQVGGVAIATSLGAANSGTQRVAIAQDSRSIPWDGTNNIAIKAASTASVAADPALVVAINPQTLLNTGLPAAAALGDAIANPSAPTIGSANLGFNGTSWERLRSGVTTVQAAFVGLLNTISMGRYNVTPPTLADGNIAPIQSDARGRSIVRNRTTNTVITSVASSTTSGVVLAANTARGGAKLCNNSTSIFYGLYASGGGTASPTNYSFILAPLTNGIPGMEEVPFGYEGAILGVWANANGSLIVTEFN